MHSEIGSERERSNCTEREVEIERAIERERRRGRLPELSN